MDIIYLFIFIIYPPSHPAGAYLLPITFLLFRVHVLLTLRFLFIVDKLHCFHSCIIVLGIIPQEGKRIFILGLGGSSPGIRFVGWI